MKRILTITSDDSLVEGLESALEIDGIGFEEVPDWETARDDLVDRPFEGVCIDYESLDLDGPNAFVQLDNILQKEETEAILLLREESEQARQFAETLGSVAAAVNLVSDSVGRFRTALDQILEHKQDPEETGSRPRKTTAIPVDLPNSSEGSLEDLSLARLVHTLARREVTGRLELSSTTMERSFGFRDGLFLANSSTTADADALQAAFAWSSGRFSFQPDASVDGQPADPYPILLEGARNHLDQRGAMNALMSEMNQHVTPTTFWHDRPDTLDGFEDLQLFIDECGGDTTLEEALSAIASEALKGFQAGFFAVECDLVVLTDGPIGGVAEVDFSADGSLEAASSAHGVPREPSTEDREAELRERWLELEDADPYEVLDLWEGCGEDEVRTQYFDLVKTNHPDSYGGNISEKGKELAEKIFIRIKDAYSELLRKEDDQTVPPEEARRQQSSDAIEIGDEPSIETSDDSGLASHSVTAMGSGKAGDESPTIGSEPSAAGSQPSAAGSQPSAAGSQPSSTGSQPSSTGSQPSTAGSQPSSTGDDTSIGDAPSDDDGPGARATMPPGSDYDPDDASVSVDLDAADSSAGNETSDPEERKKKLEQIKQRAESSRAPGAKSESLDPEERKDKLSSLRKSSSSQTADRVANLEAAETDDEATEYFNQGYKAFKEENHERAEQYFEKAHEYDSDHGLYKTFYGYTLFLNDSEKKNKAQRLLTEALKSGNKQAKPDAHLFLGRILKVKEKHDQAKKHFQRAVDLNPESVEAKRELRVYELREKRGKSATGEDKKTGEKLKNLLNKDLF